MPPRPIVSIFGAGNARQGDSAYETARATGAKLAELGYTIANGGYGGTMEASARGARDAGGRTIGVLCSLWKSRPNPYLDETVVTGSLYERVSKLIELGTGGYVVLPGATGTLVEIAVAWEMMFKGFLPRRPLVCMTPFWQPLLAMMSAIRPHSESYAACAAAPADLHRWFPQI